MTWPSCAWKKTTSFPYPSSAFGSSSQMQRLLGWSASSTLLGWVEIDGQMRDPQELLGMPSFSEAGKGF